MWYPSRQKIEEWAESLLHIHDSPERTAFAFALGVTIGFSPFVGLHTVMGLVLAFVFNLNRVAVLAGIWTNLPWVFGPYYATVTAGGAWLSGTSIPPHLLARIEQIRGSIHLDDAHTWVNPILALGELLRPLLVPFTLGSSVGCLILGLAAYRITLPFLVARKRHLEQSERH
jgi:uncharacterized protein (DUF2062 family)